MVGDNSNNSSSDWWWVRRDDRGELPSWVIIVVGMAVIAFALYSFLQGWVDDWMANLPGFGG